MNISERSEVQIKKCTDDDTYSEAKDLLPFLLYIIQTRQLAPTRDPLVDWDAAVQAYCTIMQNPGESTKKVRMVDTMKLMKRLEIDLLSPQRQAMWYLKTLDRAKHAHVLTD